MHFVDVTQPRRFQELGKKIVSVLKKYPFLKNEIGEFYDENALASDLYHIGKLLIQALYKFDPKANMNVNELRFQCFKNCTLKTACKLSAIPPTKNAIEKHCLRVYFQIQKWLGSEKDPLQFGWVKTENGLMPDIMDPSDAFPKNLLSDISCKCKKGCKNNQCSCRKLHIKCSILCSYCKGSNCANASSTFNESAIDEECGEMLAYEDNEPENERGNEKENDNERKIINENESEENDDCMIKLCKNIEENVEQNLSDEEDINVCYFETDSELSE